MKTLSTTVDFAGAALGALVFGTLVALMIFAPIGCASPADAKNTVEVAALDGAHKQCVAHLVADAEMSHAAGESCPVRASRLNQIVHADSSCAYMGSADLTAKDVCK